MTNDFDDMLPIDNLEKQDKVEISTEPLNTKWNTPIQRKPEEDTAAVLNKLTESIKSTHDPDPLKSIREILTAPSTITELPDDLSVPRESKELGEPPDEVKNMEYLGVYDDYATKYDPIEDPDVPITRIDEREVNYATSPVTQELEDTHISDTSKTIDPAAAQRIAHRSIIDDLGHAEINDHIVMTPEERSKQNELNSFYDAPDIQDTSEELSSDDIVTLTSALKDKEPSDTTVPKQLKESLQNGVVTMDDTVDTDEDMELIRQALENVPETDLDLPELKDVPIEEIIDNKEELEINAKNMLKHVMDVYDEARYPRDKDGIDRSSSIFDLSDLDIIPVLEDASEYSAILINATTKEQQDYYNTTSVENMYNVATSILEDDPDVNKKEATQEGLSLLANAIIDSRTYANRMHYGSSQRLLPSVGQANSTFKAAKENNSEHRPNKDWVLSKAVKVKDNGKERVVQDTFADKSKIFENIADNGTKRVSGNDATKIAAMLVNGFRKVNFFNSGFYTIIKAPSLLQLTKYYSTIIDNSRQYGYDLGQFSYIPAGIETKAALLDLWESCVMDSNLVNYQDDNNLRKALSVLDIPVVAWALASLVYPRGVEITHVCYNTVPTNGLEKPCRHVEQVNISVDDLRKNDWFKLNSDAIKYVDNKEPRTVEDCNNYREQYLKDNGSSFTVADSSGEGTWSAVFKIPNAYDNEIAQRAYIAKMLTTIASGNVENLEEIRKYINTKYLAILSPYISTITYTSTYGQKTLSFHEPTTLESVLDQLQLLGTDSFSTKLRKYISSKTITHICFSHHNCPICNKPPVDMDNNGLIPCDPEYLFFVWVMARLHP